VFKTDESKDHSFNHLTLTVVLIPAFQNVFSFGLFR